jgi:phage-related protein
MEFEGRRKTPVVFYQTPAGGSVVLDWLKGLAAKERAVIGQDLMRVQFRWPVGMPLCRPMGNGLWEVRSDCPGNRIARLLFCIVDGKIVVLHGSIKKTQQTPADDMKLARRRQREFDR